MTYRMKIDDQDVTLDIVARRPLLRARVGSDEWQVAESPVAEAVFEISLNGRTHRGLRCAGSARTVHVWLDGRVYIVELPLPAQGVRSAASAANEIRAQMPGVVLAVHCAGGEAVAAGAELVTIESMKLQTTIVAARSAIVDQVHITANASVARGALLVSFRRETPEP
ncbi:MAG TPA: biotin/lipoyl-containing protein [Steroidobacteraceae bacterium]|jgi:acetyl/propionyl-CoA carboxylase alpha subunit|nr:biotin/lipoyl-containing protein [Steroidobacteraceae bacterium]HVY82436.1 biotin/lipoyl-containing protein [Steroidobacteraceae bacterium]